MRIFISYTIISFFLASAVFSDEKQGRNFVDLPDVDDGYNIHVMYVLPKDGDDKDYDLAVSYTHLTLPTNREV